MIIEDIIEKAGLCDETKKEIHFENKIISYTIARKKHAFTRDKVHYYAEYYFFDLNDDLISILSDYNNKYRKFQVKLLAPHFYRHVNDLRWNLYVIFLFDDEKKLKGINVSVVENDDSYARKLFFKYEEVSRFLKREELFFNNKNNENKELKLGQFQKWVEILDDVKLTGCLSNSKLSTDNVDSYINPYLTLRR